MTGWRPGMNKVAVTKTLQSELGWGLATAKRATDDVLAGEIVSLEVVEYGSAERLAESLRGLSVEVSVAMDHPRDPAR
jgi:ribosomal protein L7/L12